MESISKILKNFVDLLESYSRVFTEGFNLLRNFHSAIHVFMSFMHWSFPQLYVPTSALSANEYQWNICTGIITIFFSSIFCAFMPATKIFFNNFPIIFDSFKFEFQHAEYGF